MKKVVPKTQEQLREIEKAISRCFLFSSLDEAQRKEVGSVSLDTFLYCQSIEEFRVPGRSFNSLFSGPVVQFLSISCFSASGQYCNTPGRGYPINVR